MVVSFFFVFNNLYKLMFSFEMFILTQAASSNSPSKDDRKEDEQRREELSSFKFILPVPAEVKSSPWCSLYSIWAASEKHRLYWSPFIKIIILKTLIMRQKKPKTSQLFQVHDLQHTHLLCFHLFKKKTHHKTKNTKPNIQIIVYIWSIYTYTYVLYWNKNRS